MVRALVLIEAEIRKIFSYTDTLISTLDDGESYDDIIKNAISGNDIEYNDADLYNEFVFVTEHYRNINLVNNICRQFILKILITKFKTQYLIEKTSTILHNITESTELYNTVSKFMEISHKAFLHHTNTDPSVVKTLRDLFTTKIAHIDFVESLGFELDDLDLNKLETSFIKDVFDSIEGIDVDTLAAAIKNSTYLDTVKLVSDQVINRCKQLNTYHEDVTSIKKIESIFTLYYDELNTFNNEVIGLIEDIKLL